MQWLGFAAWHDGSMSGVRCSTAHKQPITTYKVRMLQLYHGLNSSFKKELQN